MSKNKTYIISLGGSLIAPPAGIDSQFLKKFRSLILKHVRKGQEFFIVTGGGATCRNYNTAAKKVAEITAEDLDWLGIKVTKLNAYLLKIIFGDHAYSNIISDPSIQIHTNKKIMIGAGWQPGCSTDKIAVILARTNKIKTIINLSNIDYVYDKDPAKYKSAKKLTKVDWQQFQKIVGTKWSPGLNMPFDPVATRLAKQLGLEVVIMNGQKQKNLKNFLAGKKFQGTVIKN